MALDHVTVPTSSFDDTVAFFEEILEFPPVDHPEGIPVRARWFDVGDGQSIHVVEVAGLAPPSYDREFGRHIAMKFPHARWLRIKNQLERAEIEIIPPLRDSSVSRFFVYDPNGYCFEMVKR